MFSGARAVRFALTTEPVVEKTCSLSVDVDGTARQIQGRAAN